MPEIPKWVQQIGTPIVTTLFGLFLFGLLIFVQHTTSTTCWAQGGCSEPAATGTQPFPNELMDVFDQAGTNRLGDNGPELSRIYKGYPPEEAKLVSAYAPGMCQEL